MGKLITIGDSYTYGDELPDRSLSWPNIVARELDRELINLAQPGASNHYIFRTAIKNADEFMIVAWSECTRKEYIHKDKLRQVASWYSDPWFTELYGKRIDERNEFIQTLSYIVALQKLDKCFQCSTFSNGGLFLKYADDPEVQSWCELIDKDKFYIGFPDDQMTRWTAGAPTGPGGHPLELGHRRIAKQLLKHRYLKWIV